jgi:CSLREA domain-containing protein
LLEVPSRGDVAVRARVQGPAESRKKTLAFGVLVTMVALSLLVARPAYGKTFTVNSTEDFSDIAPGDGMCDTISSKLLKPCTLRGAIQETNAFTGPDTINFNIPGAGVKTISPDSSLPEITRPVTINGYAQPGSSPNTNAQGSINAILKIQLDGTNAGDHTAGLLIAGDASNTVIRGLAINSFGTSGILAIGSATGIKIEGNFLGTGANGTSDLGNDENGVFIGSDFNTVGGTSPDARNLISGNDVNGVAVAIGSAGNEVVDNLIGTTKNGANPLGNLARGVVISGDSTTVGGTAPGAANIIAHNDLDGIFVSSTGIGNPILSNSIHSNGGLGIDLEGGTENAIGITANDPQDPDTGANNLQNYPVLTSATTSGGTTTIKGSLNSTPSKTFILRFFSHPQGLAAEGKKFIGAKSVTTNANGNTGTFTFKPDNEVGAGQNITATATNPGGNTSEFSVGKLVLQQ